MNRIKGLLRDAWWVLLIVLVAAITFGIVIQVWVGIATALIGCSMFVYFAIIRYDDTGKERESDTDY